MVGAGGNFGDFGGTGGAWLKAADGMRAARSWPMNAGECGPDKGTWILNSGDGGERRARLDGELGTRDHRGEDELEDGNLRRACVALQASGEPQRSGPTFREGGQYHYTLVCCSRTSALDTAQADISLVTNGVRGRR